MVTKYRNEIDGLRAFAVLFVILYHYKFTVFDITLFGSGFIGVDIFFVISGYLITASILKDLSDENFSVMSFYERRIRRILPPLYTMVLLTIPFAWYTLIPLDLVNYANSAI